MDILLKVSAGALITVVLCQLLNKSNKEISLLLIITVCCIVAAVASNYVSRLYSFFSQLIVVGNLNTDMLSIILKAVGIGLISELTTLLCTDTGNGALGKCVQVLASMLILWISMPIFSQLLELIEDILGAV